MAGLMLRLCHLLRHATKNPARLSTERGLHELFQITRTLWAIGVDQWTRNIAASDPGEIPPKLADQGSAFAAVQG